MDIQKEAVREYLVDGIPYRALAEKYGVSRSTINKWVLVHQGIHNIPRSHKLIAERYADEKEAMQHITRCITIYNFRRVHSSINYQIPHHVHIQQGPKIKRWKNYYKHKQQKKDEAMAAL